MVAFARPHDPVDRAVELLAAPELHPTPQGRDLGPRGVRLLPGEAPARELLLALEGASWRAA